MLFGTSGIRGEFGKKITLSLARKIAFIFCEITKENTCAIAWDVRPSSISLAEASMEGIMETGKNAVVLGQIPTPTLAYYTQQHACSGIMITASHNPPNHNGLKLYLNGSEITRRLEERIEHKFCLNDLKIGKKRRGQKWEAHAIPNHIALIKNTIKLKNRVRVILDCSGVSSVIAPELFKQLGCEVICVNCGNAIFRNGEPEGKVLRELGEIVRAVSADVGMAFDTDGDRARIVDEKVKALSRDEQLMLLLKYIVKVKEKGHYLGTVEESRRVAYFLEEYGWTTKMIGVGSRELSERMKEENAYLAAEPCGEYIFSEGVATPDGMMSAAVLLKALETLEEPASAHHFNDNIVVVREKVCVEEGKKEEVMRKIREQLKERFLKVCEVDGIRANLPRGFILIRPSGTEEIIRITVEEKKDKAMNLAKEMQELIIEISGG
jgi:phosphoglucosamine mutase